MRNICVVTHPEATHHVEGVVGGWHDSKLTPAGARDAVSIAEALRATIPDRRLREKSYGEAGGKPQEWLDRRFIPPPAVGDRMQHDEGIPGAETRAVFAQRVFQAMDAILESRCEHQIIVTHGFAATFVLASWIKMSINSLIARSSASVTPAIWLREGSGETCSTRVSGCST